MIGTTGGHCDPQRQPRRAYVLAAAASAVGMLAAACGGGGLAGPAMASHPEGYRLYHAYSQCMRSRGAPFWPAPTAVSHGVFDPPYLYRITSRILAQEHGRRWQAALAACRKLAPPGLPLSAAQISALGSELGKLAACMRGHGITRFPSPVVNTSGAGFPSPGTGVNPDSARFRAAQRACWAHAPRFVAEGGAT